MVEEAIPEKQLFVQWTPDAASMVELEALCASLKERPLEEVLHLTLSIEGARAPKLSELNKMLSLLGPLIQGGILHIYCQQAESRKLLEFCGFPLIAEFLEEAPTVSNLVQLERE